VRLRVGPARRGGGLKALHIEDPDAAPPEPEPGERWWPWDDRDIGALRELAERAALLAAGHEVMSVH
jgi:hypothetical protein